MYSLQLASLGTLLALLDIGCSKPPAAHQVAAASARPEQARADDGSTHDKGRRGEHGPRRRALHWLWVQDDHDDRDANDDGENDEDDKE